MQGPTLPENKWPVRAQVNTGSYPCRATNGRPVDYDFCTKVTTSCAQNQICHGCECPWRICFACVMERTPGDEIRNIDPQTGLCPDHGKIPEYQQIAAKRRVIPLRPEKKVVPRPAVASGTIADNANLSDPMYMFGEEELRRIGMEVRRRLTPHRRDVALQLTEGKSREAIAEAKSISVNALNGMLFQIGARLRFSVNDMPGLKSDNIAKVLAVAGKLTAPEE